MGAVRGGTGRGGLRTKGAARASAPEGTICQLKVVLRGIRPLIWRRLLVPADMTLARLHDVLQAAMGWSNYHLHQYAIGSETYGHPSAEAEYIDHDERKYRLAAVVGGRGRLLYEYDFGDSWEHDVIVEKMVAAEKGARYPVCLAGARACPPEDCGGVSGYEHLLEVLVDPQHEEHDELTEGVGGEFDPDVFEVAEANSALGRIAGRRASRPR
jgi:hypothetical protein